MTRSLVIFGLSSYAEIVALYFSRDTEYTPVALTVDDQFATSGSLYGLPVIPISALPKEVPPHESSFHVAATYTRMNRLRREKVAHLKSMGYTPASYVSKNSYVDASAVLGEHVFVFEDNTVQPYTYIGDRVILWSGNHIGHHSKIEDDVFISSHVVVSGHCTIGSRSFLGVNCAIGNNVSVGEDNWVLPGSSILSDTGPNEMWRPQKSVVATKRPLDVFGLEG